MNTIYKIFFKCSVCGSVLLCFDTSWAVFELEVMCLVMCEYMRVQCFCMSYRRCLVLTSGIHYYILPHGRLSHVVRLGLAMILSFCSSSCLIVYVLPLFLFSFLSSTPLRFTLSSSRCTHKTSPQTL